MSKVKQKAKEVIHRIANGRYEKNLQNLVYAFKAGAEIALTDPEILKSQGLMSKSDFTTLLKAAFESGRESVMDLLPAPQPEEHFGEVNIIAGREYPVLCFYEDDIYRIVARINARQLMYSKATEDLNQRALEFYRSPSIVKP